MTDIAAVIDRLKYLHAIPQNDRAARDFGPACRKELPAIFARLAELEAERDRIERNRDMWKGQCERQADTLREIRTEHMAEAGGDCQDKHEPSAAAWEAAKLAHCVTVGPAKLAEAIRAAYAVDGLSAAPPAPVQSDGWRDIASAPKDGTLVLLAERDDECPPIIATGWFESGFGDRCWYDCFNQRREPNFWQPIAPLPASPAPKE